jgi:hypothetical protein
MILVFLASLVGMNPVPVRADSGGLICESFDSLTPGSKIGTYSGWFSDTNGPVVTAAIGVAGSTGLATGNAIFNWTARPSNWNDANFQKINLQVISSATAVVSSMMTA